MCGNCKGEVTPGNADLAFIDNRYLVVHKSCEYQLELNFLEIPPRKPPKQEQIDACKCDSCR